MLRKPNNLEVSDSKEEVVARATAVVSRVIAGETLIVPIRGNVGDLASIYSFNHTGSVIWKLLEKQSTIPQLIAGVAQEYGVSCEHVEGDVKKFVAEMLSAGLVQVSHLGFERSREARAGRA